MREEANALNSLRQQQLKKQMNAGKSVRVLKSSAEGGQLATRNLFYGQL